MLRSLTVYYVYIVLCSDESYYIGVTNDIDRRIWEHNNSEDSRHYTYTRRPVKLKFLESFQDITSAIIREKQIKGWTRKKKEALMRGDENELFRLAKGRNGYLNQKLFK